MKPMLVLLALVVAGCAAPTDDAPLDAAPDQRATAVLAAVAEMSFDAGAAIDWWEHIATAFPKHDSGTPTNQQLREHLVAELERIGLDVEVRSYAGRGGISIPGIENTNYHAVIGTMPGELAERIGLVAHYDTQTATVHGAYDDASGVAAQFHICEALAKVPLRHTLSCIFFDAEEQGLVSSREYVADAVASGEHVYDYVLGYDMTGINWPGHDWKMYLMTGPAEDIPWLQAVGQEVMHGVLGYPESGVEVLDAHDRNSDERRFKEAGIPIYRFAGGRHAADYPQYHMPQDTVEYVYDFVNGRANFEAGFTTVVEGSYHMAMVLDVHSPDSLRALYA